MIKLKELSTKELKNYFYRVTKLKPNKDSVDSLVSTDKFYARIVSKLDRNGISETEKSYWLAICKHVQLLEIRKRPRVKKSTYRKSELPKEAKTKHCFGTNVTKIRSGKLRVDQDVLPDKPIHVVGIIKKSSTKRS